MMLRVFSLLLLMATQIGPALADYDRGVNAVMMGNYATALENFHKAAANGHPGAQFELGLMYERGDGVTKDLQEAARWYRLAVAKGHKVARIALSRVEEREGGSYQRALTAYSNKDFETTFRLLRPLAEGGNPRAQARLAHLYNHGQGVGVDPKESVKWYRQSAEQGFAPAQAALALMYFDGRGVKRDTIEAYKLITDSAKKGFKKAEMLRRRIVAGMDPVDVGKAKRLVRELELKNAR